MKSFWKRDLRPYAYQAANNFFLGLLLVSTICPSNYLHGDFVVAPTIETHDVWFIVCSYILNFMCANCFNAIVISRDVHYVMYTNKLTNEWLIMVDNTSNCLRHFKKIKTKIEHGPFSWVMNIWIDHWPIKIKAKYLTSKLNMMSAINFG